MASSSQAGSPLSPSQGHKCEFVGTVNDEYKCKVCGNVAVELVLLGCCGEHACVACVSAFQEAGRPCPCCEQTGFTFLPHVRHRKAISVLEAFCAMKPRGCEWTGRLEDLKNHLDVSSNDCQFVDVQCPNKCDQPVPRCAVPDHLERSCAKRDYNCGYCGFTGSYEVVCNEHYPECDSYPIPCPNSCTVVSIERGTLDMHLNMCPYQEIDCEFAYAGCNRKIQRERLDEHMEKNVQQHLSMLSSVTMQLSQQLIQKERDSKEKDRRITEMKAEMDAQIQALKKEDGNELIQVMKRELDSQIQASLKLIETMKRGIEICTNELKRKFHQNTQKLETQIRELTRRIATCEIATLSHSFLLPDITEEKRKNSEWFSPPMYTHPGGYKFCINVSVNGYGGGDGSHLSAYFLPA